MSRRARCAGPDVPRTPSARVLLDAVDEVDAGLDGLERDRRGAALEVPHEAPRLLPASRRARDARLRLPDSRPAARWRSRGSAADRRRRSAYASLAARGSRVSTNEVTARSSTTSGRSSGASRRCLAARGRSPSANAASPAPAAASHASARGLQCPLVVAEGAPRVTGAAEEARRFEVGVWLRRELAFEREQLGERAAVLLLVDQELDELDANGPAARRRPPRARRRTARAGSSARLRSRHRA
jgi:hypothetical protein